MALSMLRAFGGGVAAPSANRFGRVSPTSAQHVRDDLGADVDFVLDGGSCAIGIESTIVDLSGGEPAILRPGGVTRESIEAVVGARVRMRESSAVRTPGQLASHYAPRAEVVLATAADAESKAAALRDAGRRVEVLALAGTAEEIARRLYAALREADARGCDAVVASLPSTEGLGLAIVDRLRKAAGTRD
jgi:L-threonylcarbamoyladenylate synthase